MRASAVVLILFIILNENVSGKYDNWLKLDNKIKGYPSAGNNRLTFFNQFGEQSMGLKKHPKLNLRTKWTSYQSKDLTNLPQWQKGTVPYHIDIKSYDDIIVSRIEESMREIERASCVVFTKTSHKARRRYGVWLHITNPDNERECVHNTRTIKRKVVVLTLGIDCMQKQDIIHALLHALGFQDEVTHPQRESFVRILWENIQPKYLPLFAIQKESTPYQMLSEYDTTSIMHFHDRAFSINGGPTVIPVIPGLQINPSNGLSQLDTMKLRLLFGQACNKRKFENLVQTCKKSMVGATSDNNDDSKHDSDKAFNGEGSDDETDGSEERIEESRSKDDKSEIDDSKETRSEDDKFESDKSESDIRPGNGNKTDKYGNIHEEDPPEPTDDPMNPTDPQDDPQDDPDDGFKITIDININENENENETESTKKENSSTTKTPKTNPPTKSPTKKPTKKTPKKPTKKTTKRRGKGPKG